MAFIGKPTNLYSRAYDNIILSTILTHCQKISNYDLTNLRIDLTCFQSMTTNLAIVVFPLQLVSQARSN